MREKDRQRYRSGKGKIDRETGAAERKIGRETVAGERKDR